MDEKITAFDKLSKEREVYIMRNDARALKLSAPRNLHSTGKSGLFNC